MKHDMAWLAQKYEQKLASARMALGDDIEDNDILVTLEENGGDTKRTIAELLGRASGSLKRSQNWTEREELRQSSSAQQLRASGQLAANMRTSGLEELPLNLNLDALGAPGEEEFDFSNLPPLAPISIPSTATASVTTSSDSSGSSTPSSANKNEEAAKLSAAALDSIMSEVNAEKREERIAAQNLTPWPINYIQPSTPSTPDSLAQGAQGSAGAASKNSAAHPSSGGAAPASRGPRIYSKEELKLEEKHDKDALASFLAWRRSGTKSSTNMAASAAARKISSDEFVVISNKLNTLRKLYKGRREEMIKNGVADLPQVTLQSKKAQYRVQQDADAMMTSDDDAKHPEKKEDAEITSLPRAAPLTLVSCAEAISSQLAMGQDLTQLVESCAQQQEEEISQVEAILTSDRVSVTDTAPRIVLFALSEPYYMTSSTVNEGMLPGEGSTTGTTGIAVEFSQKVFFPNPLLLQMIVVLPPLYPEMSPTIAIRSMAKNGYLRNSDFERLEAALRAEAASSVSMPCLYQLQQAAEEWLLADDQLKQLALELNANRASVTQTSSSKGSSSSNGSMTQGFFSAAHIYSSLSLIFQFKNDFIFHRFEDLFNQRNKIVQRATQMIVKGPGAIDMEHPYVARKRENEGYFEFPVLNLTGDIDWRASLAQLGLSQALVQVLLQSFDWKLKDLSSEYLDSLSSVESYEKFLKSRNVAVIEKEKACGGVLNVWRGEGAIDSEVECPICYCDVARHETFSLACGHACCVTCYCEYAEVHVSSANPAMLTCQAPNCNFLFEPMALMALLSARRWSTYCTNTVSAYVAKQSRSLQWCPSSAACDYIVQTGDISDGLNAFSSSSESTKKDEKEEGEEISGHGGGHKFQKQETLRSKNDVLPALICCECSHAYCAVCKIPGGHYPATCAEMNQWKTEFPDDLKPRAEDEEALTNKMLSTITRTCPSCGLIISKSGGCPHMSCSQCSYQFCWVCLVSWASSHYGCDQNKVGGNTSVEVGFATVSIPTSASLLIKHRNAGYDVAVTVMVDALIPALYRMDDQISKEIEAEKFKSQSHFLSHLPSSIPKKKPQKNNTEKPSKPSNKKDEIGIAEITISDVKFFIDAIELLHLAHYLVTNTCKLAVLLNLSGDIHVNKNSRTYLAINRVISDMIFICDHLKGTAYSKLLVSHIKCATGSLKQSVRLMLEHIQSIRTTLDRSLSR